VREAELRVEPGESASAPAAVSSMDRGSWWARLVGSAEKRLDDLLAATPLIGVLAVLLALALGAAHAALPGHGKTVMAAYLAGKRGRARDAVAVGAVVTLTHTGGVLVVGLLLTTVAGLAGQAVLGWLGFASGVLIAVVGAAMLVGLRRRRVRHHHDHHHHHHGDHHHHHHDHGGRPSGLGIAAIGVAGGLVPSPSALIVLLGAVGLGRTVFGVLLVLAYGLGMAGTLTAAGLLLVGLQRRRARRTTSARWAASARWRTWLTRLSTAAPAATGSLVLLVGLGLVGRAAATLV
jgi:ABC-type nickel/cobalt efflux system permease component RcnA